MEQMQQEEIRKKIVVVEEQTNRMKLEKLLQSPRYMFRTPKNTPQKGVEIQSEWKKYSIQDKMA